MKVKLSSIGKVNEGQEKDQMLRLILKSTVEAMVTTRGQDEKKVPAIVKS